MATLSIIGNSLLDNQELITAQLSGNHNSVITETAEELDEIQQARNFTAIGIGKPLSVEIATVYVGDYKKFLGGKKDVILVSGVKNSQTFQATSRAVNMKLEKVEEHAFLEFSALEDGTNIVYYTPAMDAESMDVSFELMFDNFDTQIFEVLSGLFSAAAGIPVFMPAAPYLMGGSQLINIGSKLGDAIFSGKPRLEETIAVKFNSPILPATEPREFVIYDDKDAAEFKNLKAKVVDSSGGPKLRLVKPDGSVYKGDAPYMIVLLDGRKRPDLESFTPTLASAAMLKKFYGPENKTADVTGALQDAMKLYNDFTYKTKGEKLKHQMQNLAPESEAYKKLKDLYDAYAQNIQTEEFKLSDI